MTGGQAVAQEPVQAEVIMVSLAYQYRVKPLASASTGPMAVLIFSRATVPDELIPELPPIELDLVDMAEADLVPLMVLAEVPGEVLLPHAASSQGGNGEDRRRPSAVTHRVSPLVRRGGHLIPSTYYPAPEFTSGPLFGLTTLLPRRLTVSRAGPGATPRCG